MKTKITIIAMLFAYALTAQTTSIQKDCVFPFCVNDKWGFIDRSGKIVVKPQFAYAETSKNGMCVVGFNSWQRQQSGFNGISYVNEKGQLLQQRFLAGTAFHNGYAVVTSDGKHFSIINKSGKIVSLKNMDDIGYPVGNDDKDPWVDKDGTIEFMGSSNGLDGFGLKDTLGNIIKEPVYKDRLQGEYKEDFTESMTKYWGKISESTKGNSYGSGFMGENNILPSDAFIDATEFSEGFADRKSVV